MLPKNQKILARIFADPMALPALLRVWLFVPLTILFIIATGLLLTLPPGPLCDEGMVLLMEGRCDYGLSNVFFFTKLGLLVAVNVAFLVAKNPRPLAFVPHFAALFVFFCISETDPGAATYYGHPNGTDRQMIFEIAALALLGVVLVNILKNRPFRLRLLVWPLWNASYVVAFYLWLAVTNHWTWLHTLLVSGTLAATAAILAIFPSAFPPVSPGVKVENEE